MNNDKKQISYNKTKTSIEWYLHAGHFYGTMTEKDARMLAGVNRTTFDRWQRGLSSAPAATLELLRLHAFGEPPGGFGGKEWRGWRFARGQLISDYGVELTPGELRNFGQYKRLAHEYLQMQEREYIQTSLNFRKAGNHEKTDSTCGGNDFFFPSRSG